MIKKFDGLSFKSKNSFLKEFFIELDDFNDVNRQKESIKKRKTNAYGTASEL